MKSLKTVLLFIICLLALFLRIYKLGEVPPGVNWDEASLGYTGYSLLKTGKDEWGTEFPLFTKQFGEYKSAIYPYTAAVSIKFFDLNAFSTRLPSAIAGTLSVLLIYFLVKELLKFSIGQLDNWTIGLIASLLLAINPWHLHFSRYALSANLALTFALTGLVFVFKFLNHKQGIFLYLAVIFSSLAAYTYHSFRIVLPLLFFFLFLSFKKTFLKDKKRLLTALGLIIILALPLLLAFKKGYLTARVDRVSLFSSEEFQERTKQLLRENVAKRVQGISFFNNRNLLLVEQILRNELTHFSTNFLFLGNDTNLRYGTGWYGKFYYLDALLIIMGLFAVFKKDKRSAHFLSFWILIAPLPAVLSNESPHPIRAYFLLPVLIILASLGVLELFNLIKNKTERWILTGFLSFIYLINFILYLNFYYVHFSQRAEFDWQAAYKPLIKYLKGLDRQNYREIFFTPTYGQPYVFLFFYQKFDPQRVQQVLASEKIFSIANTMIDRFENYSFTPIRWEEFSQKENVLIITDRDRGKERGAKLLQSFYFQDGRRHAFSVYETEKINK